MINRYREASAKIFEILNKHCETVEKASIDEAYLDLTKCVYDRISKYENEGNYTIESNQLPGSFVLGSYSLTNDKGKSNIKVVISDSLT